MVYPKIVKLLSHMSHVSTPETQEQAIALLRQYPAVVHEVESSGRTLLFWASLYNKLAVVHYLLEQRVDLDRVVYAPARYYRRIHGKTPIHIAYDKGHYDVVEALLDAGAQDIAFSGGRLLGHHSGKPLYQEKDCYLIHRAARDGQLWLMERLLSLYPHLLEQKNGKGETPLLVAVQHAFAAGVNYLASKGASLDVTIQTSDVEYQKPVLHWACQPGWYQVAMVLINWGAKDTLFNGGYAFHQLILDNQIKLVQALYERQPGLLYACVRNGQLPITLAKESNCFEIAAFLDAKMRENNSTLSMILRPSSVLQAELKVSANNVNTQDADGMTPLMRAVCAGNIIKVSKILAIHTIDLEIKVDRPRTYKHGKTALQLAYERQHTIIVCLLLDAGAKLRRGIRIMDVLPIAAKMAEIKTVERLMDDYTFSAHEREECLKILERREEFLTENRMCVAARNGYNHVLQYLIVSRQSVNTPFYAPGEAFHGKTPLDFAREAGHVEAEHILQAAGARTSISSKQQECLRTLSMFSFQKPNMPQERLGVSDKEMAESAFGQGTHTAQRMLLL